MKKLLIGFLAFGMAMSLFAGCGSDKDNKETTQTTTKEPVSQNETSSSANPTKGDYTEASLKLAILPQYHGYIIDEADKQGYYKDFGIDADIVLYGSGAPMNEALAANQWQVGSMGTACVTAVCKYNARVIASSCNEGISQYFYIRQDSKILDTQGYNKDYPNAYGTPDTVKGTTIITTVGTSLHYDVEKYLTALGLTLEDVNILNMDPGSAVAAFKAGQGDILVTCPPFSWVLDSDTSLIRAFTVKDVGGEVPSVIVVSEDAYKNHRDEVVRFLAGFFKSTERAQNEKDTILGEFKTFLNDNGYEPTDNNLQDEYLKEIFNAKEQSAYFMPESDGTSEIQKDLFDNARYLLSVGGITQEEYDFFINNAVDNSLIEDVLKLPEYAN